MSFIRQYESLIQDRIIHPIQSFFRTEAIGGTLLLVAAAAAIGLANSPWAPAYHHFLDVHIRIAVGDFIIDKPVHHWINEGLMAVFFFLVGLEIKREVLAGELASVRKAALPFAAALGGMLVPAALYAALNAGGPGGSGWGIPMATDIAFAIGILSMLGGRIPAGIPVFLTALAIIDDLGGVLVIALFYGGGLSANSLLTGFVILLVSYLANRMGLRHSMVYVVLGVALWLAFLDSGVHATVAGVLLAMTIPENAVIPGGRFTERIEKLIGRFKERDSTDNPLERAENQQAIIQEIETACYDVAAPLQTIEHKLHPWVAYGIMPVFAFANAGVEIHLDGILGTLLQPVTLGILIGLVLGKQAGIMLFSWLAVRAGWVELPAGSGWRDVYAVSWLAGIGFTMSLFIGNLAFADPELVHQAKTGILAASLIAGVTGYALLRRARPAAG